MNQIEKEKSKISGFDVFQEKESEIMKEVEEALKNHVYDSVTDVMYDAENDKLYTARRASSNEWERNDSGYCPACIFSIDSYAGDSEITEFLGCNLQYERDEHKKAYEKDSEAFDRKTMKKWFKECDINEYTREDIEEKFIEAYNDYHGIVDISHMTYAEMETEIKHKIQGIASEAEMKKYFGRNEKTGQSLFDVMDECISQSRKDCDTFDEAVMYVKNAMDDIIQNTEEKIEEEVEN